MQNYLKPNWPAPHNIRAYCTTRNGGYSSTPYDTFNLAKHVGDDPDIVQKNREKLIHDLAMPYSPYWINQVHGITAVEANTTNDTPDADASFSRTVGTVCTVLAADCLPLLVCNIDGTEIAAIHAGWKGLLAGVIDSTIEKLQSPRENLLVWLGPAIGQREFSVNNQIQLDFIQRNNENGACFEQMQKGLCGNLYTLAKNNLKQLGIHRVYGGDFCTYEESQQFFSYRREEGITGRMASLIWIQP